MIDLHLKLLRLSVDLHINLDKKAEECENNVDADKHEDQIFDDLNYLEDVETPIDVQARKFEKELSNLEGIYNIPDNSDIPPKYNISDDVEIITERFEKEVEDIIEGRR